MQKLLVLVADEAQDLRLVRTKLQTDGHHMMTSNNGQEAHIMFESAGPALVVLDAGLAIVDGLNVIRRDRKEPSVPIILLAA